MSKSYKTNYRTKRGAKRFHVSISAPPANPLSDEEKLCANIAKEKQFIKKYPNYPILCSEARTRLIFYEKRLAELLMDQDGKSYKDRLVPRLTCPICGHGLIVKEHRRRQRGTVDNITAFVACTMYERTGCHYTEPFTLEIKALLKKAEMELALQPAEF